jgi:integrase
MADKFTDAFVKNALKQLKQSGKRDASHFDKVAAGKSLLLRLSHGGSATWKALYYAPKEGDGGKQRVVAKASVLGSYPEMTPKQAYAAARAFDHGRAQAAATTPDTFGSVAEQWFVAKVAKKGLRSRKEIRRMLDVYTLPSLHEINVFDVGLTTINGLLDRIADGKIAGRNGRKLGGRVTADRVCGVIRSILVWYQSRREGYRSPIDFRMDLARDHRATEEKQRDRVLDDAEIVALWEATSRLGHRGALVRMLLLTGQRLSKVQQMRWSDLDDGVWTIRTERREKGNANVLVLPTIVRDLIASLPRIANNGFVFPAASGSGPAGAFTYLKRDLDRLLPNTMPHWVLNDLRRTARTRLEELDVDYRVAEQVLGHKIKGVEAVYNRAKLIEKKADALARLAAHIATVISPTPTPTPCNVLELREKRLLLEEQRA